MAILWADTTSPTEISLECSVKDLSSFKAFYMTSI
jgi:hypothetical protein